LGLSVKKIFR